MNYVKLWSNASLSGHDPQGVPEQKIIFRFLGYDGVTSSGNVAPIRVQFNNGGGSASCVGSDCLNFHDQNSPTTIFGWVDPLHSEDDIKSVILHEFGHVLGLSHEHQSPGANIPWKTEEVYNYYATTQNPPWDRTKVDYNIFRRYDAAYTNFTAYDPTSIMHYAIPGSLRTDGITTPFNTNLSLFDISFLREVYRYRPCTINETCCWNRFGRPIPCP
jgi:hypothetical protein